VLCHLRLAFEVREGETGGGQDHNLQLFINNSFYMILMKDLPFPLRLTFEAREGGKKLKHPLRLAFEARKGGGEVERQQWWVKRVGDSPTD